MLPADFTSKAAAAGWVHAKANEPRGGPRVGLAREHLSILRDVGATRSDVRELAEAMFGDERDQRRGNQRLVDLLLDDLDSYGAWEGD